MNDNLTLRIYDTSDSLIIHNMFSDKVISLDKTYMRITKIATENISEKNISKVYKSSGILGIIQIGIYEFLIIIKSSVKVGNVGTNTEIFEIKEVEFILLSYIEEELSKEVETILNGIYTITSQGFYYSHNFDLTNNIQAQKKVKMEKNNYDIFKDANHYYLWNCELLSRFIEFDVDNNFIVNCIYGYIRIHREKLEENDFSYILISRRNNANAGIFSTKRGLDENGHAANYVETEHIVIFDKNVSSYVQIRGTAPVYYPNRRRNSDEYSIISYNKHLQELFKVYKAIMLINMMSCEKEEEMELTQRFENLIRENEYKQMKYMYFDFDNEMRESDGVDNLDKMLYNLDSIFHYFKFFLISEEVCLEQNGAIRTNCYDGLDRSNVAQMRIAWKVLGNQLKVFGIDKVKVFGCEYLYSTNKINLLDDFLSSVNLNETKVHPFVTIFKEMWAENNDYLSKQYRRIQTLPDPVYQKCIDLFLHKTNLNILNGISY